MEKRILVTGAAGFIGFHVAMFCKESGHFVIGVDNFNPYYEVQLKKDRAKELEKKGVAVLSCDVCETEIVCTIVKKERITHIVHLAAQAGVRYSLSNPKAYLRANIDGFLSVLEVCRQYPYIHLVYASSSSVYGCNEKVPFSIKDQTDRPSTLYAATKKSNELMAHCYHHLFEFTTIGLRFFTVYGPWGRPDMAYFLFTKAAFANESVNVHDGGKMSRDFTFISDVVDAVVASLDCDKQCTVFNVGNHKPESVSTLVAQIEKETGYELKKKSVAKSKGEVAVTYADIKETKEVLGFFPKTPFEEGIRKFVDWYCIYYGVERK